MEFREKKERFFRIKGDSGVRGKGTLNLSQVKKVKGETYKSRGAGSRGVSRTSVLLFLT